MYMYIYVYNVHVHMACYIYYMYNKYMYMVLFYMHILYGLLMRATCTCKQFTYLSFPGIAYLSDPVH